MSTQTVEIETVSPRLVEVVQSLLEAKAISWTPANQRGCTANQRWIMSLDDGRSAFVKAAVDAQTAGWLHREHLVYSEIHGSFMPQLLGWYEGNPDGAHGDFPVLILEDLSACYWPPPWHEAHIEAVRLALDELAALPVPPALSTILPRMEDTNKGKASLPSWTAVAAEPDAFLSLGLCSRAWLERALPKLLEASVNVVLTGSSLVHNDVRSDNMCFRDGRAIFIDWNWTRIGNPLFDFAGWLPTLYMEGGPLPETILPEGGAGIAALLSGYWASQAGKPPMPTAPRLRGLQFQCLKAALPWALRALNLPPLDLWKEER